MFDTLQSRLRTRLHKGPESSPFISVTLSPKDFGSVLNAMRALITGLIAQSPWVCRLASHNVPSILRTLCRFRMIPRLPNVVPKSLFWRATISRTFKHGMITSQSPCHHIEERDWLFSYLKWSFAIQRFFEMSCTSAGIFSCRLTSLEPWTDKGRVASTLLICRSYLFSVLRRQIMCFKTCYQ